MSDISNISSSSPTSTILFNVGGKKFLTSISTLQKYPDTFLGLLTSPSNLALLKKDPTDGSVFIDRDPKSFRVVLNFYRDGTLVIPPHIYPSEFQRELDFYGLSSDGVSSISLPLSAKERTGTEKEDDCLGFARRLSEITKEAAYWLALPITQKAQLLATMEAKNGTLLFPFI
jgi:hypothetical protein